MQRLWARVQATNPRTQILEQTHPKLCIGNSLILIYIISCRIEVTTTTTKYKYNRHVCSWYSLSYCPRSLPYHAALLCCLFCKHHEHIFSGTLHAPWVRKCWPLWKRFGRNKMQRERGGVFYSSVISQNDRHNL